MSETFSVGPDEERQEVPLDSMKSPEVVQLTDEEQKERLLAIAEDLLESEDRQYLDENPEFDIDELNAYIVGRLTELGYDFEDVFEQAGLY